METPRAASTQPAKRPHDDDDPHEKAAAQQLTDADLGPTVGETVTCMSAIITSTCCNGTNVLARNIFMCFQPQPSRAYFLWALVSAFVGFALWFLSWDTARRAFMSSMWSWWSHIMLPLLGLAVGMFGTYDVTDRELRDEAFAANSRANCDRMMWRRGLAAAGVLILLCTAFYVCNSVWFYTQDEDMEFLQQHYNSHHKSKPSPSPSMPPIDNGGGSGMVPSWLKTPSRTPAPLPTPSASLDPTVVIRLEQIERNKKAQVGMYFMLAMSSLSLALVFNWRRQTVPHVDDADYDASDGLFDTEHCCTGLVRQRTV